MSSYDTENQNKKPEAGLYLVATPIGNLRDVTLRALDVLAAADYVLCEDTRVTRKLLSFYGIKTKAWVYNDHSDERRRNEILLMIREGKVLALVSDAGMPLISDPGYKLVRTCLEEGLYVTSLPGANAPLSALQLSGLPSDCFSFIGFLPSKTKSRKDVLSKWMNVPSTIVAFESAQRLTDSLNDIHAIMGERSVCVVREITKMFEEVKSGMPSDLAKFYQEHGAPKGEIVLVIAPPSEEVFAKDDLEEQIRNALKTMKTKEAAADVSARTGVNKKELYEIALRVVKDEC